MEEERDKKSLPNYWLQCPRKSSSIIANKFIVLKTPLSHKFDDQVPAQLRFPPKMILDLYKAKKLKIGLWIDLTNTSRFYDKSEIENEDCKYLKLQCRGYREAPSLDQTEAFVNVCYNFINQNPLDIIAVHCTHGFNRSGFMIVSYLVEKMDCSVEIALQEFSSSRHPGIYKQNYINELYRKYGDINDVPVAPALPDWYNDEGNSQQYKDGEKNPKPHFNLVTTSRIPTFMTGVTGVNFFQEQPKAHNLQIKIQNMCNWKTSKGFPGSQPVCMDVHNVCLLQQKPYRVSWKADGTRYMMLIDGEDEIYFLDRDNNIFHVEGIRFVHRKDLKRHLVNTLIDGEMVIDVVNNENIPRYLVYDIVKYEGQDVGKMPFYPVRLKCIAEEVIKPRYAAMEKGFINKIAEPFSIRNKEFWDVTQTASLLGEKFKKCLSHAPDGLIFQPSKEPYIPGRCTTALKWKPFELNSVDFRLKIIREEGVGLVPCKVGYLFVSQLDKPFSKMKWSKSIKDLDNKIIECKFENNQWVFMRERTDKSFPNSFKTAKAVCSSIQQPLKKECLLDFIQLHRFNSNVDVNTPAPKVLRK